MAGEWECYEEPWSRKVYIKVLAVGRSCEHGSEESRKPRDPTSMRIWHSVSNHRHHRDLNGRRASHAHFDYLSAAVVDESTPLLFFANCCHQESAFVLKDRGKESITCTWNKVDLVPGFAAHGINIIGALIKSNKIHQQKPVRHAIRIIRQNSSVARARECFLIAPRALSVPRFNFPPKLRSIWPTSHIIITTSPANNVPCGESKLGLGRTSSAPRSTCSSVVDLLLSGSRS